MDSVNHDMFVTRKQSRTAGIITYSNTIAGGRFPSPPQSDNTPPPSIMGNTARSPQCKDQSVVLFPFFTVGTVLCLLVTLDIGTYLGFSVKFPYLGLTQRLSG